VSIPAKANWQPLELGTKIINVVISSKSENEPNTNVLKPLKPLNIRHVISK
jgi:hypothetical protein